tara:strand:- start:472 stop:1773 length:1302 start_codon:yes stop_codon:yes gene_type:complete
MKENNKDEVLIIGLPNSGKSTLVNVLSSKKVSIIGSTPNTTRDKVSTVADVNGKSITISDLPGYLENPDELNQKFQNKLDEYINEANLILFVIDVNSKNYKGLDKLNKILRKQNKTIFTVFNKCENFKSYDLEKNLYKYIFDQDFYVSSIHKIGTEELSVAISKNVKMPSTDTKLVNKEYSIVLLGRPNSGKSTLFNSLLENDRSIVSSISGTTRDVIKDTLKINNQKYQIVDTAGVPRNKQKNQIDRYASSLSVNELGNSLTALIVVDSTVGLSFEDLRLINECVDNNVSPLLIMNKWDLLDTEQKDLINKNIKNNLKRFEWINILRISALTKKGINLIENSLNEIHQQLQIRVSTADLNIFLRELWVSKPPHPFRGKRSKLKYATQYAIQPPSVAINLNGRIPQNYQNFLHSKLRQKYGFFNICIKMKYNI